MKIKISRTAWHKLTTYVDNCEYEIGGLGQVTTDGTDFYVSDVEIFKQVVTPAHVEMTADTLAEFQMEKMRARESLVDYKFWWHSHAKMEVFWSKTDTDTMDGSVEFPWLVSVVTNHKHQLRGRIDIYKPVHVCVDNVAIEVMDEIPQSVIDGCLADIAAKVTKPAPYVYTPASYTRAGFGANLLPKKSTAMQNLLAREYYIGDDDFEQDDDVEVENVKKLSEAQVTKLAGVLVDLEEQYDELATQKKSKKNLEKLAKLTKRMDNIAYQLDMQSYVV